MKRPRDPARHRRHLAHGWPIVLNLALVLGIEYGLEALRSASITPFDLWLPHAVAVLLWLAVLWLLFGIALVMYITGHTTTMFEVTVAVLAVFTFNLGLNVIEIARTLPQRAGHDAVALLGDGVLIWWSNVLVFTVWYWLLDGGGYSRRTENAWAPRDFLFPPQAVKLPDYPDWTPHYWDYLFLAFATSTAFSPTDTQTLSRRAKALQMLQATISLAVITLIVARAINILSGVA